MGTTTDNNNGDEGVIKGGSIPGHDPFGDPSDSKATGEDPAETKSDDQSATEDDQSAEEDTTPPASESESAGQPTGSEVAIPEIIIPDTSEELMGRTGGTTGGTKSTKRQIENGEKPRGPNGGGGDEPPSTEDPDSQPQTPDEEDGSKEPSKEGSEKPDPGSRRSSIIKGAVALGLLLIAMLVIVDQCMSDSDSGSTVGDQGASPVVVDVAPGMTTPSQTTVEPSPVGDPGRGQTTVTPTPPATPTVVNCPTGLHRGADGDCNSDQPAAPRGNAGGKGRGSGTPTTAPAPTPTTPPVTTTPPTTTAPPTTTTTLPPTPTPGQCPEGRHWDEQQQRCKDDQDKAGTVDPNTMG